MVRYKNLQRKLQQDKLKTNSLESFKGLIALYAGADITPYFKNRRDENGKPLKDEQGRNIKEDTQSGWAHKFVKIGTQELIMVVLAHPMNLDLAEIYIVSGEGYHIKGSSPLYFVSENGSVVSYDEESEVIEL